MKISLLGQFGSGNTGNDGSLEAMLQLIRRCRPDAELICICSNPAVITANYNIPAMSVGGPALTRRWARILDRVLWKLPRRLLLFCSAWGQFEGVDLMIIPGTGILDDFQETAFGWPLVLFCWCMVARIRQTEIAFVSIGAGPISRRLSRWFLKSAARMASYRSYRDDCSFAFMKALGRDFSSDYRFPDIAFSLPAPIAHKSGSDGALRFAVGVMQYRGWRPDDPRADEIYDRYIHTITAFVRWLVAEGHSVRLLMGDVSDRSACEHVVSLLSDVIAENPSAITTGSSGSLNEIMAQISAIDLAVVSRYHNLVCALKLATPSISLGYARKNDDLMREFGQNDLCLHIETFELKQLIALARRLLAERHSVKRRLGIVNDRVQTELLEQQKILSRYLCLEPSAKIVAISHS